MVTPHKIARHLLKALRRDALHLVQRILAPNQFTVHVSGKFMDQWQVLVPRLEMELTEHLSRAVGKMPSCETVQPVGVNIILDEELPADVFRVETVFTRARSQTPRLLAQTEEINLDYPLVRPVTVIGRGQVDLRLPSERAFISRRHAQVVASGKSYLLEDLDSRLGTFVNDRKISRRPLEQGDRIAIGDVILLFHLEGAGELP